MTTELHFWVMPNAGFSTRPILQPHIDAFERAHPGVRIRLTIHPWSLAWNRLLDVVKGRHEGAPPDVLQVGTTWIPTLTHLGALLEVPEADVLPQDDTSAYIWDPGYENNSGQDFFCVPWFIDVRVLYYRKDIFDRLGLTRDSLQDWQGFHNACASIAEHLRRNGFKTPLIAPLALSGQKLEVQMHDLAPWVWAAGGDFCSSDLLEATLLQGSFMKGAEFFFNLINQGYMPLRDNSVSPGNFFTGHYAMQFSGSWPAETYLNPESPHCHPEVAAGFDIAPFPAGPHGRFTFLGGSNLGVAAVSRQASAAWDFVRFMSDPSRQQRHARSIGALPARIASMDEVFRGHPGARKVFVESFGHARRLPRLIELGSVERIVLEMGHRMMHLIRGRDYSPKRLREVVMAANNDINSVISVHGYRAKPPAKAARGAS